MKISIVQEEFKKNLEYRIIDLQTNTIIYKVRANRIIFIGLRKVELYDSHNAYIAKQKGWFKLVLCSIFSFLGVENLKYNYYENNMQVGYFQRARASIKKNDVVTGKVKDSAYKVYMHTGNEYSVFVDEKQVGFIKRSPWKRRNGDKYIVELQDSFPINLISMITLILDLETNPDDMNLSSYSYSTNWVIGGKKKDNNWKMGD